MTFSGEQSVVVLSLKQVADLREQLNIFADLGGLRSFFLLAACCQRVHRQDDEEVQSEGDEQEVHERSDDGTGLHGCCANGEVEDIVEVLLAKKTTDEGVDDLLDQCGDDCGEGSTDHHTDGKINGVSAGNEFLEALKHGFLLELYFQL